MATTSQAAGGKGSKPMSAAAIRPKSRPARGARSEIEPNTDRSQMPSVRIRASSGDRADTLGGSSALRRSRVAPKG